MPKTLVLPLHHEVICKYLGVKGFEPSKPLASDLQSEVTLQRYRTPFFIEILRKFKLTILFSQALNE